MILKICHWTSTSILLLPLNRSFVWKSSLPPIYLTLNLLLLNHASIISMLLHLILASNKLMHKRSEFWPTFWILRLKSTATVLYTKNVSNQTPHDSVQLPSIDIVMVRYTIKFAERCQSQYTISASLLLNIWPIHCHFRSLYERLPGLSTDQGLRLK